MWGMCEGGDMSNDWQKRLKMKQIGAAWNEKDERIWNQRPCYAGEYTNDQIAWLSWLTPKIISGVTGEEAESAAQRFVIDSDDSAVTFGNYYIQWLEAHSAESPVGGYRCDCGHSQFFVRVSWGRTQLTCANCKRSIVVPNTYEGDPLEKRVSKDVGHV